MLCIVILLCLYVLYYMFMLSIDIYMLCVCVYSTPFMSVYYSQVHVMYSLRVCIERPFLGSSDELVE